MADIESLALAWIDSIPPTANSLLLREHLSNVDVWLNNSTRTSSAIQQIAELRRCFLHCLQEDARCCGLPEKLPRCIAILNLSGELRMIYSDCCMLAAVIALAGPTAAVASANESVEAVLKFAEKRNISVLVTFSLPWQAGVASIAWDVRTLERRDCVDGPSTVLDGAMVAASNLEGARGPVRATLEAPYAKRVPAASLAVFKQQFRASNLDVRDDEQSPTGPTSSQPCPNVTALNTEVQTLRGLVHTLTQERGVVVKELNSAREALKSAPNEKTVAERAAAIAVEARTAASQAQAALNELNVQLNDALEQAKAAKAEVALLKQQNAEADLLHEEATAKAKAEFSKLKKAVKTAETARREEAAGAARAAEKAASELKRANDASLELQNRSEAATQKLQMELRCLKSDKTDHRAQLESLESDVNQNSEHCDPLEARLAASAEQQSQAKKQALRSSFIAHAAVTDKRRAAAQAARVAAMLATAAVSQKEKEKLPPARPPTSDASTQLAPQEYADLEQERDGLLEYTKKLEQELKKARKKANPPASFLCEDEATPEQLAKQISELTTRLLKCQTQPQAAPAQAE